MLFERLGKAVIGLRGVGRTVVLAQPPRDWMNGLELSVMGINPA